MAGAEAESIKPSVGDEQAFPAPDWLGGPDAAAWDSAACTGLGFLGIEQGNFDLGIEPLSSERRRSHEVDNFGSFSLS